MSELNIMAPLRCSCCSWQMPRSVNDNVFISQRKAKLYHTEIKQLHSWTSHACLKAEQQTPPICHDIKLTVFICHCYLKHGKSVSLEVPKGTGCAVIPSLPFVCKAGLKQTIDLNYLVIHQWPENCIHVSQPTVFPEACPLDYYVAFGQWISTTPKIKGNSE